MLKFDYNMGADESFTFTKFGAAGHMTAIPKAENWQI